MCFAGLAAGEVVVGTGAKVVGVSARRSRAGALFQCACLLRWEPGALLELMALRPGERERAADELAAFATGVGPERAEAVLDGLVAALPC